MDETVRDAPVSALLVGEFDSDGLLVDGIFRRLGWRLFEARNKKNALDCLKTNPVQVVIAESDFPHWNWKTVLHDLRNLAKPPQLVVSSRNANDSLWAEVLNIGGYDVLERPFRADEVERVVASARRHFDPPAFARMYPTSAAGAA